jgi:hypothetical protein
MERLANIGKQLSAPSRLNEEEFKLVVFGPNYL